MTIALRSHKIIALVVLLTLLILGVAYAVYANKPANTASQIDLDVPYIPQVYNNRWVAPYDEACEEASLIMIENYYNQRVGMTETEAKARMQTFFDWEAQAFNKMNDTSATETVALIEAQTDIKPTIKRNPTLDDIKTELQAQRPLIALVNMYELYQERNQGDSFHVLVITGYDDEKQQFIVNDPAREQHRYSYATMMNALHDYNYTSHEADAEATVIFTNPPPKTPQSLIEWFLRLFKFS